MGSNFKKWIIYEDDHILAINKPAGISSLDERSNTGDSVLRLARKYCPEAQLCHRIDKDTSGALLIAKDNETYKECSRLFRERSIKKSYLAVSEGRHQMDDLVVDAPLAPATRGRAKIDFKQGKPAETHFTTLTIFGHFTLLSCVPVTGRLHQIRVHLASQNAVIAGDQSYGGQLPYLSALKKNFNIGRGKEETPMIRRMALHAHALEFRMRDKHYAIKAGEPNDFAVFIKLLNKFDRVS